MANAGTEAPRSYTHCSASVLAELDCDNGPSFSRAYGGARMLIAADSSSAVGLAMKMAGSSLRMRNASSNAEESHLAGG